MRKKKPKAFEIWSEGSWTVSLQFSCFCDVGLAEFSVSHVLIEQLWGCRSWCTSQCYTGTTRVWPPCASVLCSKGGWLWPGCGCELFSVWACSELLTIGLLTALLCISHVKFTSVKCMLQRLFCVFSVLCVIQVQEHYNNWKGVWNSLAASPPHTPRFWSSCPNLSSPLVSVMSSVYVLEVVIIVLVIMLVSVLPASYQLRVHGKRDPLPRNCLHQAAL